MCLLAQSGDKSYGPHKDWESVGPIWIADPYVKIKKKQTQIRMSFFTDHQSI